MKIAYLLTQSLDSPSGVGRYWPIAQEMVRLGHEVEIYALHPDISSLPERQFVDRGVWVKYVAPMHVKKHGSDKSYYSTPKLITLSLGALFQQTRSTLSTTADIIHICKPHPMNSAAGIMGKLARGKRLFLDCDDYEAGSGRFGSNWQKNVVAYFERKIPHRVESITTNTHFMRQKLLGWGISPERIYYLSNGVDRARFEPPLNGEVENLRKDLGLSGKQVVAYIGSMSLSNHAVDLLVDAFRLVNHELPQSVLMFVGGGEDYIRIQEQVASQGLTQNTLSIGRVAPDKVPLYYHISDVTVDPVYDNDAARGRSPLKMFESWACGIPFVTADVGDRKILSGSPPASLLTSPGDPSSLSAAILEVLTNEVLSTNMRERGLERVKNFYWDRLVVELEKLYLAKNHR